jgi:hypothetical protein
MIAAFSTNTGNGLSSSYASSRLASMPQLWNADDKLITMTTKGLGLHYAAPSWKGSIPSFTMLQSSLGSVPEWEWDLSAVAVTELEHLPSMMIATAETIPVPVDDVFSTSDLVIGTILAFALAFLASFLQNQTPSSSNILLWPGRRNADDVVVDVIRSGTYQDPLQQDDDKEFNDENENDKQVVFSADNWKEMSRPENYVLYNTRVKDRLVPGNTLVDPSSFLLPNNIDNTDNSSSSKNEIEPFSTNNNNASNSEKNRKTKRENKLVLIALLILFVPIFSIEFFFALSRQFICGDYLSTNVNVDTISSSASPWANDFCAPH